MDKEQSKLQITELIQKYEAEKAAGKASQYTEEETKKGFIAPLFAALGWDIYERNEVTAEEQISGDRVDYGFYLNGRIKFYVEAKKLSVDLRREEFARQAIRYSWNKGVTWAVLTDFEGLIIFNALSPEKTLSGKQYLSFTYTEYLARFDELWRLSKEAFSEDVLDKEAEKVGKKLTKISVTETLSKDLTKCREMLTKAFLEWNKGVDPHLIDEGVQKFLNRLIFIRSAEDRKIEPPTLKPSINEWVAGGRKGSPYQAMVKKFRELDATYNSNLFDHHPFEDWEEYTGATEKVIEILEGKKNYFEYDFSIIPADVLGNVYENYLGYQLEKAKAPEQEGKNLKKRKEQGIYYTPKFVVDYIVQNALGPVLDQCQSINDLQQIKILDPACGSGSFLLAAMNFVIKKYEEFGSKSDSFLKIRILQNNIYGVDLDQQAVELARLNLLLNTFDSQIKLPNLGGNIKNGNSLISGTDEELEKYFGKTYRDKKPFNWQEQFPEVFKQGGFDCIIGNPPYIKEFINKSAFDGLHNSPYYQGKMDLWTLFACVSIDLLKDRGRMSFIAPNNWISNAGASIFRDKILEEGELKIFIDFGDFKVFEDAGIQTMIYVFEKQKPGEKYEVEYLRVADKNIAEEKLVADMFFRKKKVKIEPQKLMGKNITFANEESGSIFDKLERRRNFTLNDKEVGQGIVAPQESVIRSHLPLVSGASLGEGIFILSNDELRDLKLSTEESKLIRPFYTSDQINRFDVKPKNNFWIIYTDSRVVKKFDGYPGIKKHLDKFKSVITSSFGPYGLHRSRDERLFIGPSIFSIRKTDIPRFSYVDFPCFVSQTYFIIHTERCNLKYLTGLFNSKLSYFWLRGKGKLQGDMLQIDKEPILEIPIYVPTDSEQKAIAIFVDKIVHMNTELNKLEKNSNEWQKLKDEIDRIDRKIDQEVYRLYGLTNEEIKIIEKTA